MVATIDSPPVANLRQRFGISYDAAYLQRLAVKPTNGGDCPESGATGRIIPGKASKKTRFRTSEQVLNETLIFAELGTRNELQSNRDCVFSALEAGKGPLYGQIVMTRGSTFMKKLALATAAVLALLSIAGCAQYVGKGKAPPPVVTKG
jgi:hypothetical protein